MTVIVTLLLIFLIIFALALAAAFSFAFVRSSRDGSLEAGMDGVLKPYAERIREGFHFVDTSEHTRVYARSYDGLRLAASYYSCDSKRTVIVFHGYRSCAKRDYSCAVKMYMDMGMNVLLVDQRSHGESEGKLITFGVKERRDVVTWIDYVLEHFGEDTQIFLSGLSMGASTVMMAASLPLPENVKGIVADCGFTSPAEIIGKVAKQSFHINGKAAVAMLNPLCRLIGGFSLYECSTPEILAQSEIPILFIHGKSDDFVPCDMTVESYQAAGGKKEICLVEGAGHGLGYLVDQEGVTASLKIFFETYGTETNASGGRYAKV